MEPEKSTSGVAAPTPEQLLGQRVRHLRQVRGWSQTDLTDHLAARGFNMHQTTLAKLEGANRPTRLNEVAALAAVFGVDLSEMVQPMPEDEGQGVVVQEFREAQDRVVVAQAMFKQLLTRRDELFSELDAAKREIAAAREHFEECRGRYEAVVNGQVATVAELNRAMAERSEHLAEQAGQHADAVEPVEQQIEAIWKRDDASDENIERMRRVRDDVTEALKRAELKAAEWMTEQQGAKDAK